MFYRTFYDVLLQVITAVSTSVFFC